MPGFSFDDREFNRQMRDLESRVEKAGEEHEVRIEDLFTLEFMQDHTTLPTIGALFADGQIEPPTQEQLKAISEEDLNGRVRALTDFDSWKEMMSAAAAAYVQRQIEG